MARLTKTEAAYFAGFFDGEGCVQARLGNNGEKNVEMRLSISNLDPEPLEFLVDTVGGSMMKCKSNGPTKGKAYRSYFLWRASGVTAEEFAKEILPYAIVKRAQLEMYLELRVLVRKAGFRGLRQKGQRGLAPISSSEHAERLRLVNQIKAQK